MKDKNLTHLYTERGEGAVGQPWNVYPRPQMVRDSYLCLNGEWDFSCDDGRTWEKITVPFAPESLLSGINRRMSKDPVLFYEKEFTLPAGFNRGRVLLHFGAVDSHAEISLNGHDLGTHYIGYIPFCLDITDCLEEVNSLSVIVFDELSSKVYPYGKQREKRGGMWYTPVSGIWQTVWLESVPETYIEKLEIQTVGDSVCITAHGVFDGTVMLDGEEHPLKNGMVNIRVKEPHMWSPEAPYLYRFSVTSGEDRVESYFALRYIETGVVDGVPRLLLNGKPYFFHGLLDQGYYSDGIFTPASPECYTDDIMTAKSLGFNTLRKHVKVEPEWFYYECDRLGMIVFQDMVNNGGYSFLRDTALPTVGMKRLNDRFLHMSKERREAFSSVMVDTVEQLKNHPCICYWTIFNEGWGQFSGDEMYELLRSTDLSRPVDTASGWFSGCRTDIESPHVYFKPFKMIESEKPVVLSEFGGYAYKISEHSFNREKTYGYKLFESREEFNRAIAGLYFDEIIPAKKKGLSGAIYTQLSDVEDETNGLLTYDRKVLKVDKAMMLKIAELLKCPL